MLYGWAGRGRVREWKALVWGGVISEFWATETTCGYHVVSQCATAIREVPRLALLALVSASLT